jgi:hypothetical protein
MKTVQACVAAMVLYALSVVGTASAAGYPPQATKALGARYDAMARHYLGASYPLAATTALGARYDAMARHYLGTSSTVGEQKYTLSDRYAAMAGYQQTALAKARREPVSFNWEDAGVGALAATGAVALLGLGALGIRSRGAGRPVSRAAS